MSLRNLKSPTSIMHYKSLEHSKNDVITVLEVLKNLQDNENNHVFSAVVSHGRKKDTLILTGRNLRKLVFV